MRFTVLASGSSGNASWLDADGFGVLLDVGLGPRQLATRLAGAGASWRQVQAALLTHTHSDHWNDRTLLYLHRMRIPLYCHAEHHAALLAYSPGFAALRDAGLVRRYEVDEEFRLAPALGCRAFRLRHDGGLTCGFRFEGAADCFGEACALGYAADLGSWDLDLARTLGNVDLLAIEFNHDVRLERSSGRSARLIARVLGDDGHLSNAQAAALLRAVLHYSTPGRLRQIVQLHLSRDCNDPDLAVAAARLALQGVAGTVAVHTACQDTASPTFSLRAATTRASVDAPRCRRRRAVNPYQPWLPGMDEEASAG